MERGNRRGWGLHWEEVWGGVRVGWFLAWATELELGSECSLGPLW